jgi:hypothetical protein
MIVKKVLTSISVQVGALANRCLGGLRGLGPDLLVSRSAALWRAREWL